MGNTLAISEIIEECVRRGMQKEKKVSPYFEAYKKRHGIKSVYELDRAIFVKMYGRAPMQNEIQKVRFWRLRQHLPGSREEGILLGQALGLTEEEMEEFLCEELGEEKPAGRKIRAKALNMLFQEYLCQVTEERLEMMHTLPGEQKKNRRHIFFSDAIDCIAIDNSLLPFIYASHSYSRNFNSEFQKYFQDSESVSRENMIRILILLLMPDLDGCVLDEWLRKLGYAPLNPGRAWKGYVDYGILRMLELCGRERTGDRKKDKEKMKSWLRKYDREILQRIMWLDQGDNGDYKKKRVLKTLRFMKFRSIGNTE